MRDDFDGTSSNLGRNTKRLEEGRLARVHAGRSSGNEDVVGSKGAGTSGSGDLVGEDDVANILEVARGEDETDVALDVRKETVVLRELGNGLSNASSNHGVLAHQDLTLASKRLSDLMHLVAADVVDVDDEDRSCAQVS